MVVFLIPSPHGSLPGSQLTKTDTKSTGLLVWFFLLFTYGYQGLFVSGIILFVESVFDGRLGMSRLMVEDTQAALTGFFGTGEEDEGEEDEKEKTLTDTLYPTTHTSPDHVTPFLPHSPSLDTFYITTSLPTRYSLLDTYNNDTSMI
jgi:hypothetical protein